MKIDKVIPGFVIQTFDEYGICREQEFIQMGPSTYQDESGNEIYPEKEFVKPFEVADEDSYERGIIDGLVHYAKNVETIALEASERGVSEEIIGKYLGVSP